MNKGFSLRVKAELSELAAVRRFIRESAVRLNIAETMITDVVLAVDEVATNIIVHGYKNREGHIEISMTLEKAKFVIRVRDDAPVFDPTTLPPPNVNLPLEQRSPGGLGVFLMMELMDEVRHRITPQGGNELILVKKITDST